MRRVEGLVEGSNVVALGNFDGVHLGHRAVLGRAVQEGRKRKVPVVAATFDPHPRAVLRPRSAPELLTTLEERKELLLEAGADEVAVIVFDEHLSKESPEEFVRSVLVEKLRAGAVVVGENFRFGYRAAGDVEDLRRILRSHGAEAFAVGVEEASSGGAPISSTRIRELLLEGRVEEAANLLGRPYSVRGPVVAGDRRGRTIGFPTANVLPAPEVLIPARGVYACRFLRGEEKPLAACVNVGVAPTFGERERRVEAHVLGFEGDLYGEEVEVRFLGRLREEKRFGGVQELVEQIRRDVTRTRHYFGDAN